MTGQLERGPVLLAVVLHVLDLAQQLLEHARLPRLPGVPGLVDAVYNQLERTEARKADATLMGVSALLLGREGDALDGNAPWATGMMGAWGFKRLKKESPTVEVIAIQYFSLMHYLTELANKRDGICS